MITREEFERLLDAYVMSIEDVLRTRPEQADIEKMQRAREALIKAVLPVTTSHTDLLPAERLALTVSLDRVKRGDEPLPNTASMCVLALARITGVYDYTAHPTDDEVTRG